MYLSNINSFICKICSETFNDVDKTILPIENDTEFTNIDDEKSVERSKNKKKSEAGNLGESQMPLSKHFPLQGGTFPMGHSDVFKSGSMEQGFLGAMSQSV